MKDAEIVRPSLSLEERLNALEAKSRKIKWITASLAVATLLLAGETLRAAGGRSKKVEAEQFVVKDAEGRVRARLGASHGGLPELVLLDERGVQQAALQVYCEDSAALVLSEHGRTRVHMEAAGDGSASMRFLDPAGKGHSTFFMWPDGSSGLSLNHSKSSVTMGLKPNADPVLYVNDAMGKEQARLGSSSLDGYDLGLYHGKRPSDEVGELGTPTAMARPNDATSPVGIDQAGVVHPLQPVREANPDAAPGV